MTPQLLLTRSRARPDWQLLPAWISVLLVPVVAWAAIGLDSQEPWRLAGLGALCGVIMLGQVVIAGQLAAARQREEQLARTAQTDPLTGLGNRRALATALQRESRRARRQGRPATLALLDLNGFKEVNDRLGHARGDELLREFADLLRRHTRYDFDDVFRLGGDEFVLLLPDSDLDGAGIALQRIRDAFRLLTARIVPEFPVDFAVGLASLDEGDQPMSIDDWLVLADHRMYAAKRQAPLVHEQEDLAHRPSPP